MATLIDGSKVDVNSIELNGSTSGAVTIQAPAVAGTTSITLPAVSGGEFVVSDSSGDVVIGGAVLLGTTNSNPGFDNVSGVVVSEGFINASRDGNVSLRLNRMSSDGVVAYFGQDGTVEGSVTISGTTVSYTAFSGSHWSQLSDNSRQEILRGTVVDTIDEKCEWPGEENDQLAKFKISDTASSKRVYGVFMSWDNDDEENNDAYITGVGAYLIRIASGVTVNGGDLLDSNGDGCAKVQSDDIIRSSTIGKVTCNIPVDTYDDGSYTVPCVLYCG